MPSTIDLRRPDRPIRAGVILMGGTTEILDVAPLDLLHGIDKRFTQILPIPEELRAQSLDFDFRWINEHGTPAKMSSGITIQTTDSFETCPPLDIVLMGAHWGHEPNEAELAFVRKMYTEARVNLSICGGMMTPLAAGVLDGKTCTAPREFLPKLRDEAKGVDWVERRYARSADGTTWTCGTLLNGLDLMKAFVEETWGGEGTLADVVVKMGSWPVRSVEYE